MISTLLDGMIVCAPHPHKRLYEFTGRVKFDGLLDPIFLENLRFALKIVV